MTQSTQKALQDRTSRMEIELPPGVDFGVEASSKQGSKRGGNNESPTDKLKRANREAARLVADMFSSISSSTVALFPSEGEASDARVKWGQFLHTLPINTLYHRNLPIYQPTLSSPLHLSSSPPYHTPRSNISWTVVFD